MPRFRALLLAFAFAVSASAAGLRVEEVKRTLGSEPATKMGTYGDDLWIWNAENRVVTLIGRAGQMRIARLPKASMQVDVDGDRGIALVSQSGAAVEIYDWNGALEETLPLPSKASDVAWLAGRQLVVTPSFGAHRAEIWDLDSGKRVRQLAPTADVQPPTRPGAVRARTTHVRYSPKRKEIALVDAVDGTIVIAAADGRTIRTAQAPSLATPELRAWLVDTDSDARRKGEVFTPELWSYPTAALAGDGSIWLAEAKGESGVKVVRVRPNGKVERKTIDKLSCVNRRVATWDQYLIFFSDPRAAQATCPEVRRIDG